MSQHFAKRSDRLVDLIRRPRIMNKRKQYPIEESS